MRKSLCGILAFLMVLSMTGCGSVKEEDDAPPKELGVVEGQVYTNNYIGIGCELDESWTYRTFEELLHMNGVAAQSATSEKVADALANSESFYDMFAYSDNGSSASVILENMGYLKNSLKDETAFLNELEESLPEALESLGVTDVSLYRQNKTFAGVVHEVLIMEGTYNGEVLYQETIGIQAGTYIASVTLGCRGRNSLSELENCFFKVN